MTFLLWLAAIADPAAAPTPMPAFLMGCWEHRSAERWTQECWTDTRGGLMIGSSRSGSGDVIREWEWLRIERGADGTLRYIASPGGKAPVPFIAESVSSTWAVFTNAGHDYPQRIRYEFKDGRLEAEISLLDGSRPNRWSYRRAGSPAE